MLEATPKFYDDYREGFRGHDQAVLCREGIYKLREEHGQSTGDHIGTQTNPAEVEKLRVETSRGLVEVKFLCGEL